MKFVAIFLAALAGTLVEASALMIAVGVLRGAWLHSMPTVSFTGAIAITLAATLCAAVYGLLKGITEAIFDA